MYKGSVLYEAGGFVEKGKKFILSKTFIILTLHKKSFFDQHLYWFKMLFRTLSTVTVYQNHYFLAVSSTQNMLVLINSEDWLSPK